MFEVFLCVKNRIFRIIRWWGVDCINKITLDIINEEIYIGCLYLLSIKRRVII